MRTIDQVGLDMVAYRAYRSTCSREGTTAQTFPERYGYRVVMNNSGDFEELPIAVRDSSNDTVDLWRVKQEHLFNSITMAGAELTNLRGIVQNDFKTMLADGMTNKDVLREARVDFITRSNALINKLPPIFAEVDDVLVFYSK